MYVQYCAIETGRENEIPFHFPLIPPPVSHKFPWGGFLWNSFPSFSPFFPDVGEIDFTACGFFFTTGETQFTNFPPISHNFPRIYPQFPQNFPPISIEFPRNSPIFPEFPPNFPEIQQFSPNFPRISSNFPMIPTDSSWFPRVLCSFHFRSVAYSVSEH